MTKAQHAADVAEIVEVLGELPNERYRVRWDDDRESVYFPSSDATIKHATHRRSPSVVR